MHTIVTRVITGITLVTLIACTTPILASVVSVAIDGGDRSVALGDPVTLTATVETIGTANDAVIWTSSDTSVATIDAAGAVTSVTSGSTIITATSITDVSKRDSVILTITSAEANAVLSVTIDGGDRGLALGGALTLTATVETTGNAADGVLWSSSNDDVATIDAAGTVTSLTTGTTTITATSTTDGSKSDSILLTITQVSSVESVTIDGGDRSLELGDPLTFTATVETIGIANDTVIWSSSNTSVATIDATGTVTSLTTGITTITATSTSDASKSDSITLTITSAEANAVLSVTIDGGDRSLALGGALTLTTTVVTTGNADDGVAWSSGNESVATIDATGTVTSLTTGTTTITATSTSDASKSDSITLTVTEPNTVVPPGTLGWTRQFGSSVYDEATGIATDANGNVFAAGWTTGALEGSNLGGNDAFIRSFDRDGALRWTRQFGTNGGDIARGIATDASGNVYVSGYTSGALEGSNLGGFDAFIRTYDNRGTLRWTRQFGTGAQDQAAAIATDAMGNVYAAGYTRGDLEGRNLGARDAFIRSYDSNGNLRWTRQFGTSDHDEATGITTDANGNVYVTGWTAGALTGSNSGSLDVFVRSFDRDGTLRWTRQFGTGTMDIATGIAADAIGNVYVIGHTQGALEGSDSSVRDVFIRSYDRSGTLRWTRQFGTGSEEYSRGIAIDGNGNVYAAGQTSGALEGSNLGGFDAFIRSFDRDGTLRWTRQFGTSGFDAANGVATDANGNVYAAGATGGALEGNNLGSVDAFIRTYSP